MVRYAIEWRYRENSHWTYRRLDIFKEHFYPNDSEGHLYDSPNHEQPKSEKGERNLDLLSSLGFPTGGNRDNGQCRSGTSAVRRRPQVKRDAAQGRKVRCGARTFADAQLS